MKKINKLFPQRLEVVLCIFLSIYFLGGLISCKENFKEKDAKVVITMPKNGTGELIFKNYVDSTVYVKLETVKDAIIENLDRINLFDNKIYIHDSHLKTLFVFDITGKFSYKIHRVGMGPEEYNEFTSFCIDRQKKIVMIHDMSKNSIYKYSSDNGEFRGVIRIKDRKSFARNIYMMSNGDFICYSYEYPDETYCGIWILDNKGNFKKQLYTQTEVFPVVPTNPNPMLIKQLNDSLYSIFDVVSNAIYHYDGLNFTKFYQFDFSHNPITTVSKYPGLTNMQRSERKLKDIVEIAEIQETDNYIWTTWSCNGYGSRNFYVKDENKLIFPIKTEFIDGLLGLMIPTDNTDAICFKIGAWECKDLLKNDKNNGIGVRLKPLLEKTKPDDNPILQIYYMKK